MTGLDAAERTCALADRSDLGRLIATGPDFLGLLHRLSTGDVKGLAPGEGRPTILTNAKGRIVERLFVHHLGPDGVAAIAGAGGAQRALDHMARFTFAERTGVADLTGATFAYALIGPRWPEAARAAGIPGLAPYGAGSSALAGQQVHLARTNGFDAEGLIVIGASGAATSVRETLEAAVGTVGGALIDAEDLEAWRILRGSPASGHELTEDYNPLEAGLYDAVSFTKGCYVGQEVVARLNTYGKVSRTIVRLSLTPSASLPPLGTAVQSAQGLEVGTITSVCRPRGREAPAALAYVKRRDLPADVTTLTVAGGGERWSATLLSN